MSFGHLYVLFEEVSIQVLQSFLNWIYFLVMSCVSSSYSLNINLLLDISLSNMFSHLVGCLLIFLMVSFAVQRCFSLI